MKNIQLITLIFTGFICGSSLASCPPAHSVTIIQQPSGAYSLILPPGFSLGSQKKSISGLGQIFFTGVRLTGTTMSMDPNYTYVVVSETQCWYQVGSDGLFGVFSLVNNRQYNTNLDSRNWIFKGSNYYCNNSESNCFFNDSARAVEFWR